LKYDAVIVGAGCAGLSAALRMVLAGKKTLLIEQHNQPGGCAGSVVRGGYEIEISMHELCEVGPESFPGGLRKRLDEYGVKVDWVELPDCFRIISVYHDGTPMDVTLPHGIDAFIAKMEEYVPGSAPRIRELFEVCEEIYRFADDPAGQGGRPDPKTLVKNYPNTLRLGSYSTSRVFEALKLPQKCRDILSVYWSYLGEDLDHLNFFHYASMLYRYVTLGAWIVKHTSQSIATGMLARFHELGGDAWFNCRAEEFLFTGGRLTGVRTTLGDVSCDVCLANINPDIIYGTMMPKELVPEREKKLSAARGGDFRARMLSAFFVLDRDYRELGIENYVYFLQKNADSAEELKDILKGSDSNEYCIFLCPNVADPTASPEGTCICSITTMGAKEEWEDLTQEEYFKRKDKIFGKMLEIIKNKTGVDLKGHILEMATASPWTYARYLNTPEGAVYGYAANEWDNIVARSMMMKEDYPVKGLFPIGASGPRGDGYSGCFSTGAMMADAALEGSCRAEGCNSKWQT